MDIPNTDSVNYAFASAQSQAMQYRHEFITPEHLLSALLEQVPFQKALAECFCTPEELSQSISEYLSKKVERVPQEIEYVLEISGQLSELLQYAYNKQWPGPILCSPSYWGPFFPRLKGQFA